MGKQCVEHLRQWTKKVRKSLRFGIPMVWREPKNRLDNCYLCAVSTKGIKRKNRNSLVHLNLESAIGPIPHRNKFMIQFHTAINKQKISYYQCLNACPNWNCLVLKKIKPPFFTDGSETTVSDVNFTLSLLPQLFYQLELNDLTKNLNFS